MNNLDNYKIQRDDKNMMCQVCKVERTFHTNSMTKACAVQFKKDTYLYPVLSLFVMKPKDQRKY